MFERLYQIIVGATTQTTDAIVESTACGEHQHRHRILATPELSQNRQTVAVG